MQGLSLVLLEKATNFIILESPNVRYTWIVENMPHPPFHLGEIFFFLLRNSLYVCVLQCVHSLFRCSEFGSLWTLTSIYEIWCARQVVRRQPVLRDHFHIELMDLSCLLKLHQEPKGFLSGNTAGVWQCDSSYSIANQSSIDVMSPSMSRGVCESA